MKIKILDFVQDGLHQDVLKEKFKDIEYIKCNNEIKEILNQIPLLQENSELKLIVLSKNSALTFMLAAKHKDIVVAEITDAHSAFMTLGHNNANILALSLALLTPENLVDIIENYIASEFEAGRHMVRIDMMNKLLVKEGE